MMTRNKHSHAPAAVSWACRCRSAGRYLAVCLLLVWSAAVCRADPCGMVPPAWLGETVPLERIGLQKTYVFYQNGIETFVIRPGFRGRVEEFGMLIPFPSPPALRKVADDTFAHIAAAVDPPEVVVDLTPRPDMQYRSMEMACAPTSSAVDEGALELDQVQVLNQEAVGMYEVAVLEAGSAAALNRWMTDHGYRYPEGMDDVCNDYVKDKWCFVAVKARVGSKASVDPRPGMKDVDTSLPEGASFDGHVQGMGFRFRSDELVVPMRLSAFNEGDLHNVLYLLTDKPMKAADLPAGHVVRQVSGKELLRNITQPLPLRIIGGTFSDVPKERRQRLKAERDPVPHNGIARDLFAGDLLAVSTGHLSHPHEELEKELLNIGERLNLRGPEIDVLHEDVLREEREHRVATAVNGVASMTMTVIDGDFERAVIARDNLRFARFEMNPARNTPERYNARMFGPGPAAAATSSVSTEGAATTGSVVVLDDPQNGRIILQDVETISTRSIVLMTIGLVVTVVFICVLVLRRRGRANGTAVGLILVLALTSGPAATGQPAPEAETAATVRSILAEIGDGGDRDAAISRIAALGDEAVSVLVDIVRNGKQIQQRGWAVVCLSEMGGGVSANGLDDLIDDSSLPVLVRTWVAAARLKAVQHEEDLARFSQLCSQLPALRRPLRLKVLSLVGDSNSGVGVEQLVRLAAADHELQQSLAPVLLKSSPAELARVMVQSSDMQARQFAASLLATMKTKNVSGVNAAVVDAVRFRRGDAGPPWGTGPLYVPGTNWSRDEAIGLINELTAWFIWCAANEQEDQLQKIRININSWQLMQAAGYQQAPENVSQWTAHWQQVIGEKAMKQLMQRTGFVFSEPSAESSSDQPEPEE